MTAWHTYIHTYMQKQINDMKTNVWKVVSDVSVHRVQCAVENLMQHKSIRSIGMRRLQKLSHQKKTIRPFYCIMCFCSFSKAFIVSQKIHSNQRKNPLMTPSHQQDDKKESSAALQSFLIKTYTHTHTKIHYTSAHRHRHRHRYRHRYMVIINVNV